MKPLVSLPSGICRGPLTVALAAVALATLSLVAGRPAVGAGVATATGDCAPPPSWPAARPAGATAMLAAINAHRATRSLAPLRLSATLTASATWKARHMAAYNYMAHDHPKLFRLFRARSSTAWRRAATGAGQARTSPAAIPPRPWSLQTWLAEPAHRANIEGGWSTTGIAVAVSRAGIPYWVEDFGMERRRSATAACLDASTDDGGRPALRRPAGDRPPAGRCEQAASPGGLRRAGRPACTWPASQPGASPGSLRGAASGLRPVHP